MRTHDLILVLLLVTTMSGCAKNENERLAEMAERHLQRQAEQNQQMTELQHEVAAGARELVEADARAREEIIELQRDIQVERSEIGRQRDALEEERRDLAAKRHLDPIIAAAITSIGLILACLLPLVLCWYLLRQPTEPASDREITELLIGDLVADQPLLLPGPSENRGGGLLSDQTSLRLQDDPRPNDRSKT